MSDNGFSKFKQQDPSPFRLFCEDTFLQVFGNSNASATKEASTQAPSATELAVSGASESCKHQWLRPVNGEIECALCSTTRWAHYGEEQS